MYNFLIKMIMFFLFWIKLSKYKNVKKNTVFQISINDYEQQQKFGVFNKRTRLMDCGIYIDTYTYNIY